MIIHFYKMTGAGNDFVMLDNRDLSQSAVLDAESIEAICDRRFGVGADGLIAVEPPTGSEADFKMRYFNADGSEAEMCGNGARCFARFADALAQRGEKDLCFETLAGLIHAHFEDDGNVTINLTSPHSLKLDVVPADDVVPAPVHFINTGVPHAVTFLPNIDEIDVKEMGAHLRYHEAFAPAGTNANFVEVIDPQHIAIRTYERGVEDETLACGTGMTACALIHATINNAASPVLIDVKGGDTLRVSFRKSGNDFTDVFLTGPADFVYEGETELD